MPDTSGCLPIDRRPMTIVHWREAAALVLMNTVPDFDYVTGTLTLRDLTANTGWCTDTWDLVEHFPCWEAQEAHRRQSRHAREFLLVDLLSQDRRRVLLRQRLFGVTEEVLPGGCRAFYDTLGEERVVVRPPFRLLTEPMWDPAEEIQF